jgi:hypothetical protein
VFGAVLGNLTPSSPLVIVDSADPQITRQFGSVEALAEEQWMVRIWGGIHFRSSLHASDYMGRAMVTHILKTVSRPHPERRSTGAEELKLSSNC